MQHRISAGVLIERQGRVLLVRSALPGRYDFWVAPGGGVEGEESIEQAAIREVREETGLMVKLGVLTYVEDLLGDDIRYCKFWFTGQVTGGEMSCAAPEAKHEHITDVAWHAKN